MNLSGATGAIVTDGRGRGTIINDDPLPALAIDDVVVTEGDLGTTEVAFPVSLSAPSGETITVDCATADGSALAGEGTPVVQLLTPALHFRRCGVWTCAVTRLSLCLIPLPDAGGL